MNRNLTWLHLSDIHFSFQNFDTLRMRDRLLAKLEEITAENTIDFVVVTGDLSYQGKLDKKGLSNFFDDLIAKTSLKKDSLYIVPGNHDVHRSSSRTAMLKSFLNDTSEFDDDMETNLLEGQSVFFNFYKDYMGVDYKKKQIHWVQKNESYNLLRLNTALTCGRDKEEGLLKINSTRLFTALKEVEKSPVLNIAIGHHGLDCLNQKDSQDTINQFIDYNIDIYLCGHIHKAAYTISTDGNINIPTLTCGAAVVDDYSNAYFMVESFDGQNTLSSKCYEWDFSNQQWVKDSKVSRKTNEDGITKFQIDRFSQQYSYEDIYIDNDIFRDFIIEFHQNFDIQQDQDTELYKKDITEKFINMKCNKSMVKQYDKLSLYFPVISQVMHSTTFMSTKNKLIISSVIIEAYNNNFDLYDTGHKILEAMVHEIFINYKNKIKYTETNLKLYIKVLCCWLIYECDIFDDKKE